jgi:hypothetical protein
VLTICWLNGVMDCGRGAFDDDSQAVAGRRSWVKTFSVHPFGQLTENGMAAIISLRDLDRRPRSAKRPDPSESATILMFTGVRIDRSGKGLPVVQVRRDEAEFPHDER